MASRSGRLGDLGIHFWYFWPYLDWRWKQVTWEEGSIKPLNRRGHSADYDPETNSIVLFGGMFGYSKFLGDCFQIFIDEVIQVVLTSGYSQSQS
jgi:hypothetical protein